MTRSGTAFGPPGRGPAVLGRTRRGEDDQGMQIQIGTDKTVHGSETLIRRLEGEFESALSRFTDRITRLGVHLGEETAAAARRGNGGAWSTPTSPVTGRFP